jgi:hypothetical protein
MDKISTSGVSLTDDVYMKKKLVTEQEALIDQYITRNESLKSLTAMQKDGIYEEINLRAWYFLVLLYSSDQPVPCITLSTKFEDHLNFRDVVSNQPIVPKQYS